MLALILDVGCSDVRQLAEYKKQIEQEQLDDLHDQAADHASKIEAQPSLADVTYAELMPFSCRHFARPSVALWHRLAITLKRRAGRCVAGHGDLQTLWDVVCLCRHCISSSGMDSPLSEAVLSAPVSKCQLIQSLSPLQRSHVSEMLDDAKRQQFRQKTTKGDHSVNHAAFW